MSSDFLYSEEITDTEGNITYTNEVDADSLNGIAIDLGCADYNNFADGEEYAISKLNEITKDLTSKGILQIGNECAVTCSAEENKIYIADGVCVFSDGSKWRSQEGVTIESFDTSTVNYVYLCREEANNKILACCTTAEPVTGDFVMLAEVSADGVVTDKREWSTSKTSNGSNVEKRFSMVIPDRTIGHYHSAEFVTAPMEPKYVIVEVDRQEVFSYNGFFTDDPLIALPWVEGGTNNTRVYDDVDIDISFQTGKIVIGAHTNYHAWDETIINIRVI